jgi:hypothetical protein
LLTASEKMTAEPSASQARHSACDEQVVTSSAQTFCKKTVLFLSFPYVCPEPVLAK